MSPHARWISVSDVEVVISVLSLVLISLLLPGDTSLPTATI